MRLGFTGTQSPGPEAEQIVREYLSQLSRNIELVVGCCIGMDTIVGVVGQELGFRVHGVVPFYTYKVDSRYRDYCTSIEHMPFIRGKTPSEQFMARNQRMVDIATIGYTAFPRTAQEELRSGTWATIRRAWRKFGTRDVLILPVGGA